MFVSQDYLIGFRDIDKNYELTNKALLGFFEDTAGKHSNIVGYGLLDISRTKKTWFLISIKLKVFKRPKYSEKITITTWCTERKNLYAIRNYEAKNEKGEVFAIASSKWVSIDAENNSILKFNDELNNEFGPETKMNFEDERTFKIKEPTNYSISKEFQIYKSMIDINNHVHNTYYLDFLKEVVPEEIQNKEINELEILYKNQIFYDDTITILYSKELENNYVVIKSDDSKKVNAIIKF